MFSYLGCEIPDMRLDTLAGVLQSQYPKLWKRPAWIDTGIATQGICFELDWIL